MSFSPAESAESWRQDHNDLLNYFLGHGRENRPLYSRQAGHSISQEWAGSQGSGRLQWVKWAGATEWFRWDAVGVYLVEDQSATPAYGFSRGLWFPRHGNAGQRGRNDQNIITWYDAACGATKTGDFRFEWYIESLTRDELVVHYIWGPRDYEINTYTWADGWVRWRYVHDGKVKYDFVFDQPGQTADSGASCS